MPAYDFKCLSCGDSATVVNSIKETTPTPYCFKCKLEMTKQFNIGAVTFKGQGFYSND